MRKILTLLALIVLSVGQLLAQNRTIAGKVTDSKGVPLSNASVLIKGTTVGTTTNEEGRYSLTVPPSAKTLIISSVGLSPREVAIGNKTTVNVSLEQANEGLEQVIVVAYGTAKKSEYTGSAAQINAKEIEKRPIMNVTNALVGSAPGIQTTTASGQPGSSPGIRLRGFSSYSGSSSPLIVVDGVPYDGGIANINADDVESISTLKDASTTALFGSRGANGVIMVTTKKGKKNRNQVTFKMTQGYTERGLPEYDKVDAYQYYPLMWESYRNSLAYKATPIPMADANKIATGLYPRYTTGANAGRQNYNGTAYSDISQLLGYNPFNVPSTDIVREDGTLNPNAKLLWADDLDWAGAGTRTGNRQDYQLSYSGGNDKSDYFGSFGYTSEKGFAVNSDFKRFSGRVSVNTNPTTWFRTGFNMSGSTVKTNQAADGGIVNPFYFSRYIAPIYPVYAHNPTTGEYLLDVNGQRFYDYGSLTQLGLPSRPYNTGRHTVAENLWNQRLVKRNVVSGRAFGEITFIPDLKGTVNISTDIQDYLFEEYDNRLVGDGAPSGRSRRTVAKTTSYTFNQLLNYTKKIGQHNLAVLAGHETYDLAVNNLSGSKQGQIAEGISEFPNFSTINGTSSSTDKKHIESYLSRLNYDFSGKYFVSGSFRRDGNSLFAPDVRWANFWSAGAGWRLDKEEFLKVSWIDQLKLRASYGKVGNDAGLGYYPYQGLYSLGFNNALEPGYVQSGTLPNPALTWESVKSLDFGVDFVLFKNRLSGSIEYFNRVSDGLIFSVPQPLSNGGTTGGALSINRNIGSMYNRGIEVQLTGDPIRGKDFSWTVNVNATTFRNKITKMPVETPEIISGTKKRAEGQSLYEYWLRHYYGVDPTDGSALYAYNTFNSSCRILDNGKGGKDTVTTDIANAKYFYVGETSIPKVYGSVSNSFRYKDFELSIMITYQLGGKIYDGAYASLMHAGTYGAGWSTDILNRWQKPGDITNVPRLDNSKVAIFDAGTDRWLIDASYLSINNVNLSYNLPKKWLGKINAQNARVYLSGENLAFFSKRKGMNVNGAFDGTTGDTYNVARVLTAGVNITF